MLHLGSHGVHDVEVAKSRWPDFCREFARRHQGALVAVRRCLSTDSDSMKPTPLAHDQALYDIREGQQNGVAEVMVTVREGNDDTSFLIENAIALYRLENGSTETGLRVDSSDGTTTLVELAEEEPAATSRRS